MIDPWKILADGFVLGGVIRGVMLPLIAIFNGQLYGPGAFLAGAIIISTVIFGEFYFREV